MRRKVRNLGLSIHSSSFTMLYFRILGGRRSLRSLLVILSVLELGTCISTLRINTTIGTVHGFIDDATPKVAGIPFAESPVASLRFAAPTAKDQWRVLMPPNLVLRVPRLEVQARLCTALINRIC